MLHEHNTCERQRRRGVQLSSAQVFHMSTPVSQQRLANWRAGTLPTVLFPVSYAFVHCGCELCVFIQNNYRRYALALRNVSRLVLNSMSEEEIQRVGECGWISQVLLKMETLSIAELEFWADMPGTCNCIGQN